MYSTEAGLEQRTFHTAVVRLTPYATPGDVCAINSMLGAGNNSQYCLRTKRHHAYTVYHSGGS